MSTHRHRPIDPDAEPRAVVWARPCDAAQPWRCGAHVLTVRCRCGADREYCTTHRRARWHGGEQRAEVA